MSELDKDSASQIESDMKERLNARYDIVDSRIKSLESELKELQSERQKLIALINTTK